MRSLGVWTLVIIFYQTLCCTVVGWLTLNCKLAPVPSELHEITLIKLLYLYEPEACGRVQFFNYTVTNIHNMKVSTIIWPVKNSVALSFRNKIGLWLSLHVLWLLLGVVNLTQGHRPCGFYVALLPFTVTGCALLVIDVLHMALFIGDIDSTHTEQDILEYIQTQDGSLRWMTKKIRWRNSRHSKKSNFADTSWISVLMAYISVRGVVQWIINFWIVKDNYLTGLAAYRTLVFAGAITVHNCVWSPENSTKDYDKLARVMYLYDPDACGYEVHASRTISNLKLSNDTRNLNIRPIKWTPAITTVSSRTAAHVKWYINISVGVHQIWMITAILLRLFVQTTTHVNFLNISLALFFYASIGVIAFDVSMAIVYVSDIKKSLTKGMILRYTGWSVEMKLQNYTDFGGWIPLAAAGCWMRGVIILALNMYCCRILNSVKRGMKSREVKRKLQLIENEPIPEPRLGYPSDTAVLYYRTGEHRPYISVRSIF